MLNRFKVRKYLQAPFDFKFLKRFISLDEDEQIEYLEDTKKQLQEINSHHRQIKQMTAQAGITLMTIR